MQEEAPDFALILDILAQHDVDFIVVGGVCAVLLGAPVATFDLDIVHSRSNKNLGCLVNALDSLNAHYREHLPEHLKPTIANLDSTGHHLLLTRYGPLDVLGSIGVGDDYEVLKSNIETISINDKTDIKILNLNTLIDVKTKTARTKDKPMLEILAAMTKSTPRF